MKKIFYSLGIALLMIGCSDDYTDWSSPNMGGAEDGKSIALAVSEAPAIDFAEIDVTDDTTVQLFVPSLTASDENETTYEVTLWNADKTMSKTITADANGYVSASELKEIVESLYGKRPEPRQIPIDVAGFVKINGQSLKAVGNTTATVTPKAPIIYEEYYVVGNVNGWNINGKEYVLSNGGADPYENPVFTGRIPVPDGGGNVEFKVNPKGAPEGSWDLCLTPDVDGQEGKFSTNNAGPGNLTIPEDPNAIGFDLTFNMMDQEWSYKPVYALESTYYIVGTPQGWNPSDTSIPVKNSGASPADDPVYSVILDATGSNIEFKLCPESGVGGWDSDFTADPNGAEGKLAANNAGGNIVITHVDGAVAYHVWFNLQDLVWGYNPIMENGVFYEIGNESGWSTSHPMMLNGDSYIGFYFLNGEFKFKPNANNWDNDLEWIEDGKLDVNGIGNVPAPETGFYKIVLNTTAMTYNLIKINTVGVIGDATADGWNSDQDMSWNAEGGFWHIENLQLNDGTIKFRGNDNWDGDLDLGGNPNSLSIGGANIPVEAGTYDIKLFASFSGGSHAIITKK